MKFNHSVKRLHKLSENISRSIADAADQSFGPITFRDNAIDAIMNDVSSYHDAWGEALCDYVGESLATEFSKEHYYRDGSVHPADVRNEIHTALDNYLL